MTTKNVTVGVQINGKKFLNVVVQEAGPGYIRFIDLNDADKGRREVQIYHSGEFQVVRLTSLSCGHKLDSYYSNDGGNAGVFSGCEECEGENK